MGASGWCCDGSGGGQGMTHTPCTGTRCIIMHLDVVSRRAARDPLFTLSARVPALSENPHSCAFEAAGWVLPAVAFMNALQSSGKRSRQRGRGRGGPPDGNELLPKAAVNKWPAFCASRFGSGGFRARCRASALQLGIGLTLRP